jgi:hypothetical protein
MLPKTRNQKKKQDTVPVSNTLAKKIKNPTKRGRKKKELINITLNNGGDDEISEPAKVPAKRS